MYRCGPRAQDSDWRTVGGPTRGCCMSKSLTSFPYERFSKCGALEND